MPQNLTDDKSTLNQLMAWCRQATSHYLNQCWPRSPMPYGVGPKELNLTISVPLNGLTLTGASLSVGTQCSLQTYTCFLLKFLVINHFVWCLVDRLHSMVEPSLHIHWLSHKMESNQQNILYNMVHNQTLVKKICLGLYRTLMLLINWHVLGHSLTHHPLEYVALILNVQFSNA